MPIFLAATVGQQDVLLCLLLVDDADVKSIANIYKTSAFWPSLSLSIHTNQTNHTNYLIIMAYDIFGATIILSSTFICEKLAKNPNKKTVKGAFKPESKLVQERNRDEPQMAHGLEGLTDPHGRLNAVPCVQMNQCYSNCWS